MTERRPRIAEVEEGETEGKQPKMLDQEVVDAFAFLTNRIDYRSSTLEEMMASDGSADISVVEQHDRRKKSFNVLYMSELLTGSRYADIDFFNELLERVGDLPKSMKPDTIVMSGLLQGDFRHKMKNRKPSLQAGLETMSAQFYHGRKQIDKILGTGIPLVYTMGDDDLRIAEDMALDAMQRKMKLAMQGAKEDPAMKAQLSTVEKAKANPQWTEYYRFSVEAVFPYCLRAGRRLRTAEEVSELTDGEYCEPEREILYDAYKRASRGDRLQAKHYAVLERGALTDKEFTIVDDFNHQIGTKGQEYTDRIRHNLNLSPVAMTSAYFGTPVQWRGAEAADGNWDTDNLVTMHNQEASGLILPHNTGIHSIGGMQDPSRFLDEKGHITASAINPQRRMRMTRKRAHAANATAIERTDDGRQLITIFNRALMEKSDALPDRVAFTMWCDWQLGSLSARLDYQIKQMDMTRLKMGEMGVVIAMGGDFVHGRNYPDFFRESQRTGMMSIDAQETMLENMIVEYMSGLSIAEIRSILTIAVSNGNHEWNTGTFKFTGDSNNRALINAVKIALSYKGMSRKEVDNLVQFHDTLVTPQGEPLRTYSTLANVGDVGLEVRHFFGAGGGLGGKPPAFQAHNHTVGLADLKRNIDIQMIGHYHHGSYMIDNNKISVGSGSLAGLTGYEYERGLRSVISTSNVYMGGGLPPQIEFVSEETLIGHKIKDGSFSDAQIKEEFGYEDDPGFDPTKHGIYLDNSFPKSALQKRLLQMGHSATHNVTTTGLIR